MIRRLLSFLDPVTVTVVGVIVALLFPIAAALFAVLAYSQGNMHAAKVFFLVFIAGVLLHGGNRHRD